MPKIKHVIIVLLLLTGLTANAHDFEYPIDRGGRLLYYNILDKNKKTVEVTYQGKFSANPVYRFQENFRLEIPGTVETKDGEYKVVKIGAKAFENAEGLSEIVFPATLKEIGNFAFKDCKELKSIYYNSNVELGIGAFYDCTHIENVRFSSDWKKIDFEPYRWSRKLSKVVIPPSTTIIEGLKYLKNLTYITVDDLNRNYASENGILYNKNKQILIYCPRNYGKTINIYDGCVLVDDDALSASVNTEEIIIPASVQKMSFRETRRMDRLQKIVLGASKPFFTGYDIKGEGFFFFQLVNPYNVQMFIPDKVKVEVFFNEMPRDGGNFSVEKGGSFYPVFLPQLPLDDKKHLLNVKNNK